jgi:hypothetical protein
MRGENLTLNIIPQDDNVSTRQSTKTKPIRKHGHFFLNSIEDINAAKLDLVLKENTSEK